MGARRVSWGPIVLLVGYLVVAPAAFVLGPLAGLLALSEPRSAREWAWLAVAAGASGAWVVQQGNTMAQVVRAAAVLLTGAYVALTIWRPAPGWGRAAIAVILAGTGLELLMAHAGIGWHTVLPQVAHQLRAFGQLAPAAYRAGLIASADRLAAFFPALLALVGGAGIRLAWIWHCRLAERPIGERFCSGELNL